MNLANFFNHDFKDGDFVLYDKNGNELYFEHSDGYWIKKEYDKNNNLIYFENSREHWAKYRYDKSNNIIYWENSRDGVIIDKKNIIEINGKKYKLMEE
jgi:hypothetical protein